MISACASGWYTYSPIGTEHVSNYKVAQKSRHGNPSDINCCCCSSDQIRFDGTKVCDKTQFQEEIGRLCLEMHENKLSLFLYLVVDFQISLTSNSGTCLKKCCTWDFTFFLYCDKNLLLTYHMATFHHQLPNSRSKVQGERQGPDDTMAGGRAG